MFTLEDAEIYLQEVFELTLEQLKTAHPIVVASIFENAEEGYPLDIMLIDYLKENNYPLEELLK